MSNHEPNNEVVIDLKMVKGLVERGFSKPEITKHLAPLYPELSYDKLYHRIKRIVNKINEGCEVEPEDEDTFEPAEFFTENGDVVLKRYKSSEKFDVCDVWIRSEGHIPDEKEILAACGIDETKYQVKDYTYEEMLRNVKDEGPQPFYKVKVRVEPKRNLTFDDISKTLEVECNRIPLKKRKLEPGKLACINLADIHFGMYAAESETGKEINNDVMKARFENTIADFIDYVNRIGATKVRFVTLGDVVHVDNSKQTTTNGTFQQIDGRLCDIMSLAIDELVSACDTILAECPQVVMEYVYVPGNHDRDVGQTIAIAVEKAFRNEPNITFDITQNPFKFKEFGKTFVGYHHGDLNIKNIDMATFYNTPEKAAAFSRCVEKEMHFGHLHHGEVHTMKNGITVRYMPSICGASAWEHQQGYGAVRGTVFEEYDEDSGLVGQYFSKIFE